MAGYLYIFANSEIYVKLIEKLSRRHLINSSDVFVIKGFTVGFLSSRQQINVFKVSCFERRILKNEILSNPEMRF